MKKIFVLILLAVLLVGTISAFEFDNRLAYSKGENGNNDLKVKLNNWFGLGKNYGTAELKSHNSVNEVREVGAGNQVVMWYDFNFAELYKSGLGEVYFTDMRTGEEIDRDYSFVYWGEKERDVYGCEYSFSANGTKVCNSVVVGKETFETWLPYDSKDIPKGNIRIGLMTYVKVGDKVDGVWTIGGKKVSKHAEWTAELSVGLVSYWKFDEQDITGSGTIIDSYGSNDGTNTGTENTTGKINTAYNFSGNDYIKVNDSDDFNLPNGTIAFWIEPDGTIGANEYLIGKDFAGSNDDFYFRGRVDNKVEFAIQSASGTKTIISDNVLLADTWVFLGVTFGPGGMKMYVNNTLQIDTDTHTGGISGSSADLFWGALTTGTTAYTGKIDEGLISGREFSADEFTQLWNNHNGISYLVGVNVVLLSPEDEVTFTTNNINFSANVSDVGVVGIQNVTIKVVYPNGTLFYNETNTSGFEGIYNWTDITIPDGNWNWSVEAYDDANDNYESLMRVFSVDTTAPQVVLLAPPLIIDFHLINTNLSVNWSANDTHIDTCILQFEGSNRTVTCSDNQIEINITNAIDRSIIFYVNDTFGRTNSTSRSWDYIVFENSQEFNEETPEGIINTFTANVTIGDSKSITTASLIYNGTSNTGSFSPYISDSFILTIDFLVPNVDADINLTFFWSLLLSDDQIINLTSHNQTVISLSLDDCSVNTIVLYNYTVVDEGNQSLLSTPTINVTTELNINLLDITRQNYIINFSKKYLKINPFAVCINKNLSSSTYIVDSVVKYEANAYSIEYYNIINATITNSTIPVNITLYDLFSADATEFKITFKAEDFTFVENALIYIDRQYIAENNTFKTVELPKTDSNGQTIGHFVRNDVVYNIRVIKNGVVLGNFKNIIAFCDDYLIGNCQIVLEATPEDFTIFNYDEQLGIIFQSLPTYNENTSAISFSFSTDDGTIKTVLMEVTRDDIFGNRSICNNTLVSSSGTLSCSFDPGIDDAVLRVGISVDGQPIVLSNVRLESSDYGNLGYILWFFLTFLFILLFAYSKTEILIGLAVSFMGAIALGITRGNVIGLGSAGIWVLVIVILGIWKLNKEKPQ